MRQIAVKKIFFRRILLWARGLSLIEVLLTVVLISVSLMTLLQGISQSLQALDRSEQLATAAMLAKQKMSDLELRKFQIGVETSGVFKNHKNYSWNVEIKDPDLAIAKDFAISQVNLTVSWKKNGKEEKIFITTYTARIQKLQE